MWKESSILMQAIAEKSVHWMRPWSPFIYFMSRFCFSLLFKQCDKITTGSFYFLFFG